MAAAQSGGGSDKGDKAAAGGGAEENTEAGGLEGLDTSTPTDGKAPDAAAVQAAARLTNKDIVVLPRKAFLKGGRFEFAPFTGTSVNDILIRHYVFGLDLTYFLTDALSVGLQGDYYIKALTERETLIGLQYNRIPTLNRYVYGAALNFAYSVVYGKFALFNNSIIHWEIYASGGVGITRTETITRNPGDEAFHTNALTPNAAIGGRFFLADWLTINYAIRDYVILDKFESTMRPAGQSAADAQAQADSKLVNNVMLYAGVGLYLPTKFQYRTAR